MHNEERRKKTPHTHRKRARSSFARYTKIIWFKALIVSIFSFFFFSPLIFSSLFSFFPFCEMFKLIRSLMISTFLRAAISLISLFAVIAITVQFSRHFFSLSKISKTFAHSISISISMVTFWSSCYTTSKIIIIIK